MYVNLYVCRLAEMGISNSKQLMISFPFGAYHTSYIPHTVFSLIHSSFPRKSTTIFADAMSPNNHGLGSGVH